MRARTGHPKRRGARLSRDHCAVSCDSAWNRGKSASSGNRTYSPRALPWVTWQDASSADLIRFQMLWRETPTGVDPAVKRCLMDTECVGRLTHAQQLGRMAVTAVVRHMSGDIVALAQRSDQLGGKGQTTGGAPALAIENAGRLSIPVEMRQLAHQLDRARVVAPGLRRQPCPMRSEPEGRLGIQRQMSL